MSAPEPRHAPDRGDLERLALDARRGDARAHEAWYAAEFPRVWRLALGILADPGEAEEVAQEAMLHLSDKLELWDPGRPYAAWSSKVVVNRCRDHLRRRGARRDAEERAPELPERLPHPEDAAAAGEVREILTNCLADLAPREREVFCMRDLEGHSTRETARVLDVTESTVRSLLTLARKRLRRLLATRAPGLAAEFEGGSA